MHVNDEILWRLRMQDQILMRITRGLLYIGVEMDKVDTRLDNQEGELKDLNLAEDELDADIERLIGDFKNSGTLTDAQSVRFDAIESVLKGRTLTAQQRKAAIDAADVIPTINTNDNSPSPVVPSVPDRPDTNPVAVPSVAADSKTSDSKSKSSK